MTLSRPEFERLAIEQLDMLYRMARRLSRDPQRAEDLVQETYLRAIRSYKTFNLAAYGIRPWLYRILYNLHLSRGERDGRQPVGLEPEQLEALESSAHDSLPIDPRSFESMDGRLVTALEGLADEYRSVLLLWAIEDFTYQEVADALNIPIGTVMSRLHRARQRLSEQLKDYAAEERLAGNRR